MNGWKQALVLGGMVAIAGCSHTRPEEMSAEQHRAEAAKHEKKAEQEEAQYDPSRTPQRPPPRGTVGNGPVPVGLGLWEYNPTEFHKYNAEREREHAADHLRAAQRIESFENAACRGVSKPERAACPLLTPFVHEIVETRKGAILEMKKPSQRDPLFQRMRCHWAFARARAFEQHIACPLYEHDVTLRPDGAAGIAIEGSTPQAVQHIRTDLRQLFTGAPWPEAKQRALGQTGPATAR